MQLCASKNELNPLLFQTCWDYSSAKNPLFRMNLSFKTGRIDEEEFAIKICLLCYDAFIASSSTKTGFQ